MPIPVVPSSIDVALWFFDQSRRENMHLPAQKLQNLLWLAQGIYASANHGRLLMPAVFVAQDIGPIEPSLFHLFEDGRPPMPSRSVPAVAEHHLLRIWRKYAHYSADYLGNKIRNSPCYRKSLKRARGEVIPFAAIAREFTTPPTPERQVRARDGRVLEKWTPGAKPSPRHFPTG